ncbi:MAG: septum formation protein Maf [Acidobacteria bacterium]|nr:septum formation protein Maf [Acidobacteriota bacterium]
MKLILASGSPRRADILRAAGIEFEVLVPDIDESRLSSDASVASFKMMAQALESPSAMVKRLAEAKVRAVAKDILGPGMVIGADTAVVVDNLVLGKPASSIEARKMLHGLSGRTHEVLTGLTVFRLRDGITRTEVESTRVTFATLSEEELNDYISSGEFADKAGAYGIQGRAGRFVTRLDGCYFNVMGLPLAKLYKTLRDLNWKD